MKTKGFFVLLVIGFLIMISAYYAPFISFKRLFGEIEIERWAAFLRAQGRTGRDCVPVVYGDVNQVLHSMGRKTLPKKSTDLIDLPVNCLANMQLVEMRYYGQYNAVSGIYRCEDDSMIQEVQLAVYLRPRSVPQEDYCSVGSFLKAWDIPVGAATMFATP